MSKSLENSLTKINQEYNNLLSDGQVKIDPKMKPIIRNLLFSGINTFSSCESHYDRDFHQILLVTEFNKKIIELVIEQGLFDLHIEQTDFLMKFNSTDYKRCIITQLFDDENTTKDEFEKNKSKYLSALKEITEKIKEDYLEYN